MYDFLENEVKEVVKGSYDSTLQGWYHHIILSNEGELYITGPLSVGTVSMGCYNGDEVILAKINASREFDVTLQWDDILSIGDTIEERHNKQLLILDKIIDETEVQALEEEIENCNQNFSLLDCLNCHYTYLYVEEAFKELFPEKWSEIINDYIDDMWGYDKESIEGKIEHTIEDLKLHIKMSETYEDDIEENLI